MIFEWLINKVVNLLLNLKNILTYVLWWKLAVNISFQGVDRIISCWRVELKFWVATQPSLSLHLANNKLKTSVFCRKLVRRIWMTKMLTLSHKFATDRSFEFVCLYMRCKLSLATIYVYLYLSHPNLSRYSTWKGLI